MPISTLSNRFLEALLQDDRLTVRHISLSVALLYLHEKSGFQNPFWIMRDEVMHLARIQSRETFYHGIRAIAKFGYIQYRPSYNRLRGSLIHLNHFA